MTEHSEVELRSIQRDLWEMERRRRTFERLQQVLRLYVILGALSAAVGVSYIAFSRLELSLTQAERFALIVSAVGLLLSVLSGALYAARQQRFRSSSQRSHLMSAAAEFLLLWARLERAARERLSGRDEEFNTYSLRSLTAGLVDLGLLSPAEHLQLDELLRLRNALVHGGEPVDVNTITLMTERLRQLLRSVEQPDRR